MSTTVLHSLAAPSLKYLPAATVVSVVVPVVVPVDVPVASTVGGNAAEVPVTSCIST